MHRLGPRLDGVDRALVVGLGGGGDVCGTIPTRHLLDAHGIDAVLGGAAWQRKPHDPHPGPRPLDDFEHVEVLGPTTAKATPRTRTSDGVTYPEAAVADLLDVDTVLVDLTRGPTGVAAGIREAMDALACDLAVGVDVGGDLLADGSEPGLRSPLCDSVVAAGIVETGGVLASFGLCADGELTYDEVHAHLASLDDAGGYLGAFPMPHAAAEEMERVLARIPSEASRIPLLAFRGDRGPVPIRHGVTEALAHDGSTLTHYIDPDVFVEWSPLQRAVQGKETLLAANDALHDAGVDSTELDVEDYMEAHGITRYTDLPGRQD